MSIGRRVGEANFQAMSSRSGPSKPVTKDRDTISKGTIKKHTFPKIDASELRDATVQAYSKLVTLRRQWHSLVNVVKSSRVPQNAGIFGYLRNIRL